MQVRTTLVDVLSALPRTRVRFPPPPLSDPPHLRGRAKRTRPASSGTGAPGERLGRETRTIHNVDEWLTATRDALAEAASISPEELELDDEDARTLLELARIAAHESGDRTNAPLLCYLVGRVQRDATLDDLAAAVRRTGA
jgi:hypothetical protein